MIAKSTANRRIGAAFPKTRDPSHLYIFPSVDFRRGELLCWRARPRPNGRRRDHATTDPIAGFFLRLPETLLPDLQPLLATALAGSSQAIQGRLSIEAARGAEMESKSVVKPHLSLVAGAEARQEFRADIPGVHYDFAATYDLSLVQPLWHWGALDNQVRVGRIQRELAESDFAEARRDLTFEVRTQYVALIMDRLDCEIAQENQAQLEQNLKTDENPDRQRAIAPADLKEERLTVASGALALEKLNDKRQRALRDFAVLLGRETYDGATLPAEVPPVPAAWAQALRPPPVAESTGGTVPAALARPTKEKRSPKLNHDTQNVRQRPVFDLAVGTRQDQESFTPNIGSRVGVQDNYLGLRLTWSIFDGGATTGAIARTQADLRRKTQALTDATKALRRQVADGWTDLDFAQRELDNLETKYQLRTDEVAADRRLNQNRQISDNDLQTQISAWKQLRADLMRARAAQLLQIAEYALLLERATRPASDLTFP